MHEEFHLPQLPLPKKKKSPPPAGWRDVQPYAWKLGDPITKDCFPKGENLDGYYDSVNYAVPLGHSYGDGFLMVLDIDPKNEGDKTIKQLEIGFGSLPKTLTVRTGSGGLHYYFVSQKPFKTARYKGCDFQGRGAYVLGPGSIHPNGQLYEIIEQLEIANMPDWFDEIIELQTNAHQQILTEGKKVSKGERNSWLTSQAGLLRRYGFEAEEIAKALGVMNATKLDEPVEQQELERIAKSVERYEPAFRLQVVDENFTASHEITQEDLIAEIWGHTHGLIKDIAETILEHAPRQYREFALSAAFSITGAAAQGAYITPEIDHIPDSGMALNTYSYNAHVSAGGKDVYHLAVAAYGDAIDPYLVIPELGSAYGLRSYLYAQNTAILNVDEILEFLIRMDNPNVPTMYAIGGDLKKLYNAPKTLKGAIIKGKKYPDLKYPHLSIFGTGTKSGFRKQLSSNFIGGGLASRFTVWSVDHIAPIRTGANKFCIPESQIIRLREIYKSGMQNDNIDNDVPGKIALFDGEVKNGIKMSAPDCVAVYAQKKRGLDITSEANTEYLKFRNECDACFLSLRGVDPDDTSGDGGSIYARAPVVALKYATLHAIGRGSLEVDGEDMILGGKIAKWLADALINLCGIAAADTPQEAVFNKILDGYSRYAKKWVLKGVVHNKLWRIKSVDFNEITKSLWLADKIECQVNDRIWILPNDADAEHLELPRGAMWRAKK
jgi:hypothetical protein